MNLHYSQTGSGYCPQQVWFYYLMNLHYSQTIIRRTQMNLCFTTLWIYTILKHEIWFFGWVGGFTTLWIYTILKPCAFNAAARLVLLPYEFTLFSNLSPWIDRCFHVLLPYEFTLFSNDGGVFNLKADCFTTLWIYTILKRCPPYYDLEV